MFPLHVSWCFDVGLLFKENQSLACLGSRWMCWEPQHWPYSPCLLRNLALLGTAPFFTGFLSSHLATLLPLPGTISSRATGNPPVCWKASFSGTQQPFQTGIQFGPDRIRQESRSFRHCEMTSDRFRKEILWQEKCLCLEESTCGLGTIF